MANKSFSANLFERKQSIIISFLGGSVGRFINPNGCEMGVARVTPPHPSIELTFPKGVARNHFWGGGSKGIHRAKNCPNIQLLP